MMGAIIMSIGRGHVPRVRQYRVLYSDLLVWAEVTVASTLDGCCSPGSELCFNFKETPPAGAGLFATGSPMAIRPKGHRYVSSGCQDSVSTTEGVRGSNRRPESSQGPKIKTTTSSRDDSVVRGIRGVRGPCLQGCVHSTKSPISMYLLPGGVRKMEAVMLSVDPFRPGVPWETGVLQIWDRHLPRSGSH